MPRARGGRYSRKGPIVLASAWLDTPSGSCAELESDLPNVFLTHRNHYCPPGMRPEYSNLPHLTVEASLARNSGRGQVSEQIAQPQMEARQPERCSGYLDHTRNNFKGEVTSGGELLTKGHAHHADAHQGEGGRLGDGVLRSRPERLIVSNTDNIVATLHCPVESDASINIGEDIF